MKVIMNTDHRGAVRVVTAVLFVSAVLGAVLFFVGVHPLYAALTTLLPPAAVAYVYAVENMFEGDSDG